MANFLESFLSGAYNAASDNTTGVGQFLDNIVPDAATLPGNALNLWTAIPRTQINLAIRTGEAVDTALSRPVSTALQAGASNTRTGRINPLYRDGIQLQDFVDMWNASEYISPGRAALQWQWAQTPQVKVGRNASQEAIALNAALTNPYPTAGGLSQQQYEDAWDNSAMGTIASGTADIAWQLAEGKGIGAAAGVLRRGAGLAANIKSARDLTAVDKSVTDHIRWAETNGAEGAKSHWGNLVMDIANSKNLSEIYTNPFLNAFTRTGSLRQLNLAEQLTKVNDPYLVRDMILADRGDAKAIGRLFVQAPDHVWSLSDMNSVMRAKFSEGGQWHPSPEELPAFRQTFDSAVQRDEFFSAVRDMFMQTEGVTPTLAVQGMDGAKITAAGGKLSNITRNNTSIPMTGLAGRAQKWLYQSEMAVRTGGVGMWVDHKLGPLSTNAPVTTLLQWVGGRKPLNHVSLSGMRPTEVVDEMMAYSASSRALRGAKQVTVNRDVNGVLTPVTLTMDQWRNQALARLGAASNGGATGLASEIKALEGELVSAVTNKYQIAPDEASGVITGLQQARDISQADVARDGFFFDEVKGMVQVHPQTRRQLADDIMLLPLDELDREFRALSETAFAKRSNLGLPLGRPASQVLNVIGDGIEWVLRFWRTNQLFKPGYTPKNAGLEPGMSAFIAHGSIVSPDGLMSVFNNYVTNRARQLKALGYWTVDKTGISGLKGAKSEVLQLHRERMQLQALLDEDTRYLDDVAAGRVSPADQSAYLRSAVESRRSLGQLLTDLETRLDVADPGWRQVQEVPTYGQLSSRIDDIAAVVNGGKEWEAATQKQIDDLLAEARSRSVSSSQDMDQQIAGLEESLQRVRAKRAELSAKLETDEIVGNQTIVGGPADMTVPKVVARGRDYQGTALARQEESLLTQIENLKQVRSTYEAPDENLVPLFLSPAQRSALNRLESMLALRQRYVESGEDWTGKLASLREQQAALSDEIASLSPDILARKLEHEAAIAEIDGKIRTLTEKNAPRIAKREAARERKLGGEGPWTAYVGPDSGITIPGLYDEGSFGAAMRAEFSSAQTNIFTYDPSGWGSAAAARWIRSGGVSVVQPTDPQYWEQLAYVANRQARGDQFATEVLRGKSLAEVAEWLRTPAGRRYADGMGWTDQDVLSKVVGRRSTIPLYVDKNGKTVTDVRDIRGNSKPAGSGAKVEAETGSFAPGRDTPRRRPASIPVVDDGLVAQAYRLIHQYFPDPAVRARLLEDADVKPSELMKMLGTNEALSPITAGELNWAGKARIRRAFNNAFNSMWANLATKPEDRFGRFPFADAKWRQYVQEDARFLEEQGQPITAQVLNNLRASAATRALKETEQTFYNIRRYSNPVYAMRFLYGFPGAYFNSLYRYMRFATKYPGRAFIVSQAYTGVYQSFGVDKDGNKTDNWQDVKSLVFPMPPGWKPPFGMEKISLSTQSIDFVTQQPSFLPVFTVPMDSILAYKPGADDWVKQHWGEGVYNSLFPFGQPATKGKVRFGPVVGDQLFAGWELDLVTAFNPSDEDFVKTVDQIHMDNLARWEQDGSKGQPPTPEQAAQQTQEFWFGRAFVKFFGLGGTRLSPAGEMMRQEWYQTKQKFGSDYAAAKADYIGRFGPEAEYYIQSSSNYRTYMPASMDAYQTLETHSDLANQLRAINPDNPQLVSLLFWGADTTFDYQVYQWMQDNALPGDTQNISTRKSPEQMDQDQQALRSWEQYDRAVASRDATVMKYGYSSLDVKDAAWLKDQWNTWLDAFKAAPENAAWLAQKGNNNAEKATMAINALHTVLTNKDFMQTRGQATGFQIAGTYLTQLQRAQDAYNSATTSDQRNAVKTQWDQYVTNYLMPGSSDFASYYTRNLQGEDLS